MIAQKRVAAIHDISGIGKCSLTVALPILSAAGIETAVMPTAVLSTHTGGIDGFTYRDLTSDLRPIAAHWKSLGIGFDAIYSGFLGSREQIDMVCDFIDEFRRNDTVVLVDPAMADNGAMYSVFDRSFASEMAMLCAKADIVIPNMTEAAFLLGEGYRKPPYEPAYIDGVLRKLSALGPAHVVLTGVMFEPTELGAAVYDRAVDTVCYAFSPTIAGIYHGTGDVFASAVLAAFLSGRTLQDSVQLAVDFTCASIRRTRQAGTDVRFGVNFEAGIYDFIKAVRGED